MATTTKKSVVTTKISSSNASESKSASPSAAPKSSPAGSGKTPRSRSTPAPVEVPEGTPPQAVLSSPNGDIEGEGHDRRSTSPGLKSRVQEKRELADLNDRLANYIDIVRRLEQENSQLHRLFESQETTVRSEVTGIKVLYEDELAAARRLLDELSAEKAKLLIDVGKLLSELGDVKEKLRLKDIEATDVGGQLRTAEALVKDLQSKLNDSEILRQRAEAENKNLKRQSDALAKNQEDLKQRLEEETVSRIDFQNQAQSLREELSFLKQVHDQELNESITRTRVVVDEADERLKVEYDIQLRDTLLRMREEMDEQLCIIRDENETVLQKRLEELNRSRTVDDGSFAELRSKQADLDELRSRLSQRNCEKALLEARASNLEDQLVREQNAHQSDVDSLNADLRHLRGLLDEQLQEFKDLMDVKIRLDAEISAYRKLLESEELRLDNLEQERSPCRKSPGEAKKRKFAETNDSSFSTVKASSSIARSNVVSTSHAQDVVEIDESSADGLFVKLFNASSDKDVDLTDWQLRQLTNDGETTYKFPQGYELKPQQHVTVWGKESSHSASAVDLLMKNQDWSKGESVLIELLNQNGEKMAYLEVKWLSQAPSRSVLTDSEVTKTEQAAGSSRWKWSPLNLFFRK